MPYAWPITAAHRPGGLLAPLRPPAGRPGQPGCRPACGYVTGELALIAPGGQAGESRPPRDSRAASCHGDNEATTGHRPGICRCSAASTPSAPAAGPASPGGSAGSSTSASSNPSNHARTRSARRVNRRSQPRTVSKAPRPARRPASTASPPRHAAAPSRSPPPSTAGAAASCPAAARRAARLADRPPRPHPPRQPAGHDQRPLHPVPPGSQHPAAPGNQALQLTGTQLGFHHPHHMAYRGHRCLQAPRTALPVATATETGGPFGLLRHAHPVAGDQHPTSPSRHPRPQ